MRVLTTLLETTEQSWFPIVFSDVTESFFQNISPWRHFDCATNPDLKNDQVQL